jgi:hypothetical protein
MPLVLVIVSIVLMGAYALMFLRPKWRLLAAASVSASAFCLYLALNDLGGPNVSRVSVVMLGVTGLGAIALGLCHIVFERGSGRGNGTDARRDGRPPRELAP